jgi:hypothetical protein
MQAMRGDVADPRREVGLDVPVQLPEYTVERGEQRGVAAVVGMAQRLAAEEGQAGDQRRGGADDGVGGIDDGLGKTAVVGDAEIDLSRSSDRNARWRRHGAAAPRPRRASVAADG